MGAGGPIFGCNCERRGRRSNGKVRCVKKTNDGLIFADRIEEMVLAGTGVSMASDRTR